MIPTHDTMPYGCSIIQKYHIMILVYDTLHYDQPKNNSALYMAFLHMWKKERQGKSGEVGSHARASLNYMVEHWNRHLYGGGQESGNSRRS